MTFNQLITEGEHALFSASAGFAVNMRRQAIGAAREAVHFFRRAQDVATTDDAHQRAAQRLHSVSVLLHQHGYSDPAAPAFQAI